MGSGVFGRVSTAAGAKRKERVVEDDDDEDEDEIEDTNNKRNKTSDKDDLETSDDDLADDPLTAKPRKPPAPKAPAKRKAGRPRKEASPVAISDDEEVPPPHTTSPDEHSGVPVPSQSSDIPTIPRALLLRLMHEHFASKETKIDKHALAVLEKYVEIYIRESIARSLLAKKDDVEKGAASQSEERWLEKSDLEKIVAGVVMDF